MILEDNENSKYHNLKGLLHYNLEEYKNAIESFTNLITLKIEEPKIYHARGLSNLRIGQIENAKNDFNKAISINKNYAEAYFCLGMLYFEKFENFKAIDYFIQSIKIKNKFDQAIKYLSLALATNELLTYNSNIINSHNEIRKIKVNYSENKLIDDIIVKDFYDKVDNIVQKIVTILISKQLKY